MILPLAKMLALLNICVYIGNVAAKSANRIGVLKEMRSAQPRLRFFCAVFLCALALWRVAWGTRKGGRFLRIPERQPCVTRHPSLELMVTILLNKIRSQYYV